MAGQAVISLCAGLEDPEKVTVAFLVAVGAAESGRHAPSAGQVPAAGHAVADSRRRFLRPGAAVRGLAGWPPGPCRGP
jgi:hypothetical protein